MSTRRSGTTKTPTKEPRREPKGDQGEPSGEVPAVNEVRLRGRLSAAPMERTLPSGDTVWTFRVVVARPPGGPSRQRVDTLDCAVWRGRLRRSLGSWAAGDVVEVTGAVRRRFFASGAASVSRVEIEVAGGRLIRRRGSG